MKFYSILSLILFASTITYGQNKEVYDKVLADAELSAYNTYAIGNQFNSTEDQDWVKYSSLLNGMIENSIVYEFDTYGFDMDKENGELVVNFTIFDEAYKDQVGYMPGFSVEDDFGFNENILNKLQDGSLVVSITDINDGQTVWTGFVPNAIVDEGSLRDQQKGIRQAVNAAIETFITRTNFADTPSSRFEMVNDPINTVGPDDDESN